METEVETRKGQIETPLELVVRDDSVRPLPVQVERSFDACSQI